MFEPLKFYCISVLYHSHQCKPCSYEILRAEVVISSKSGINKTDNLIIVFPEIISGLIVTFVTAAFLTLCSNPS